MQDELARLVTTYGEKFSAEEVKEMMKQEMINVNNRDMSAGECAE